MRKLINYFRQCFCKHEFILEEKKSTSISELSLLAIGLIATGGIPHVQINY